MKRYDERDLKPETHTSRSHLRGKLMNSQSNSFLLRRISIVLVASVLMTTGFWILKQSSSPSVRAETETVLGDPLPNLTLLEQTLFDSGDVSFVKLWDAREGMGPVATQLRCNGCHGTPVDGGSSPTLRTTFFGKIDDQGNFDPMLSEGGPVLQTKTVGKFKPSCPLPGEVIPADATIRARHVPPMLFGLGLVDSIPDADILANAVSKGMGIQGKPNMVDDENGVHRVGRFGHKSEDATLLQFVAGALQHDMGITNPINQVEDLPQGQPIPDQCAVADEPNDKGRDTFGTFHYVLYLAPNTPGTPNPNGQTLFNSVGCALCHIPTFMTGPMVQVPVDGTRKIYSKALSSQQVNLYSDLLLHDMGTKLQDGVYMGDPDGSGANGRQFRTAPLWGTSAKLLGNIGLLHNGLALTVDAAIRAHQSGGSEANQVIDNYIVLSPQDQADLIAFVSSL